MADTPEVEDGSETSKIPIHSKSTLTEITSGVIERINDLVDKRKDLDDEQKQRLKMRFAEIYKDSIHENVSCDGQSWQEAEDELNVTQEFEPMNTDLQTEAEKMSIDMDDLIVKTTRKRKYYPRKIVKHITTEHNCYSRKLKQYEPNVLEKVGEVADTISEDVKTSMLTCCQSTASTVSSLMKTLPETEIQSERLLEALQGHETQQSSKTRKIILKSSRGEGEMMKSLTPLKKLMDEDFTPSPKGNEKRSDVKTRLALQRLKTHSITKYNLRSSPRTDK